MQYKALLLEKTGMAELGNISSLNSDRTTLIFSIFQIIFWKNAQKEALESALEEKNQIPARFRAYYKKLQDTGDIKVVEDLYNYGKKKIFGHGQ